ncbi:MAG: right-handed parallel beta-helix repeat-containing protein [Patescibacteria group bacterium]
MKQLLLTSILLTGLFIAFPSLAAEWWIDADNGINTPTCNTKSNPCASFAYVYDNDYFLGGDTVYIKGTMEGEESGYIFDSTHSGTANKYTVITAWPGEDGIFDATGEPNFILNTNGADYITIKNLTFKNSDAIGIQIDSSSYINLQNLNLNNNNNNAVYIHGADNVMVTNSIFHSNTVSNVHTTANIYAVSSSKINFINNTFYNNKRGSEGSDEGSDIYLYSTEAVAENNIFDTSDIALNIFNPATSSLVSNYNIFNDCTKIGKISTTDYISFSNWQAAGYDANSMEVDPLLISASGGYFDIQATSPAIDAAQAQDDILSDYEGNFRPLGDGYDIGAYEFENALEANLSVTDQKSKKLTVEWDSICDDCTYHLQYSVNQDFSDSSNAYNLNSTATTLTKLKTSKKYYLRINALNNEAESEYTDAIFKRTLPKKGKVLTIKKKKKNIVFKCRKMPRINKAILKIYKYKKKTGKYKKFKTKKKKNGLTKKKVTFKIKKSNFKKGKYKVKVRGKYKKLKGPWSKKKKFRKKK